LTPVPNGEFGVIGDFMFVIYAGLNGLHGVRADRDGWYGRCSDTGGRRLRRNSSAKLLNGDCLIF